MIRYKCILLFLFTWIGVSSGVMSQQIFLERCQIILRQGACDEVPPDSDDHFE